MDEGGVGVGVPSPGAVASATCASAGKREISAGVGMIRNCPSRTIRSGPSPFQSAKALAEMLKLRAMVMAVSPRLT